MKWIVGRPPMRYRPLVKCMGRTRWRKARDASGICCVTKFISIFWRKKALLCWDLTSRHTAYQSNTLQLTLPNREIQLLLQFPDSPRGGTGLIIAWPHVSHCFMVQKCPALLSLLSIILFTLRAQEIWEVYTIWKYVPTKSNILRPIKMYRVFEGLKGYRCEPGDNNVLFWRYRY